MPKTALHSTFFFFLLTALTGSLMRYLLLFPDQDFLPFSFILHGHSHVALLGWTFLGVFLVFLKLTWRELASKQEAIWIIIATFVITTCMFIAFLYQGYALFSIIFSVLHIGIEYWMAVFLFKTMKQLGTVPPYTRLFIKGACISLIISSVGPFSLGGLGMAGMKDSPFFEMAIYFFLHFQYNGWLYLMLLGTFLFILHKKQIPIHTQLVSTSFWVYIISLFPAYALSISWYGLGIPGILSGVIGAVGQFAGILLLLVAISRERKTIQRHFSKHIQISLLFIFILLVVKALMEFGLLYEPFAALIFETRSVIIGYLHLTLLGFITIFILIQYQMTELLNERKNTVLYGLAVFIAGFIMNEVVLFSTSIANWLGWHIPYGNEVLLLASLILVAGIVMIWISIFKHKSVDA